MKREAGGQGEFSVGRIFGAATPPIFGRQDFWVNFESDVESHVESDQVKSS